MEEGLHCHSCGALTDHICDDCNEPVCDECVEPFTIHNQCDGNTCKDCHESSELAWTEEFQREEEIQRQKDEKREIKNAKRRDWYSSTKQIEKRRLAKIELHKWRREQAIKRMEEVGGILKGFGF